MDESSLKEAAAERYISNKLNDTENDTTLRMQMKES